MQRTANLITALTALALAVAFVAGLSFQAQRTDAAAATIAALNVGTCHTTDLDVLDEDDCNPHYESFEYNRQGLDDAIEVKELYATYAFDPFFGGTNPRAILEDSDLLKISITDEGRDVRRGVLMMRKADLERSAAPSGTNPVLNTHKLELRMAVRVTTPEDGTVTPTINPDRAQDHFGAVVAGAISDYAYDGPGNDTELDTVPGLEQTFSFKLREGANPNDVVIDSPGIVELILDGTAFDPIATGDNRGEMRFFGSVDNSVNDDLDIAFGELSRFLEWDEDVNPGSTLGAPAVSIQANPRTGDTITLHAIHYLTSDVEYLMGGEKCLPRTGSIDDPETEGVDEGSRTTVNGMLTNTLNSDSQYLKENQAACTDDELGDDYGEYDAIVLSVDAGGAPGDRNIYLEETGRFSGVFQGFVRLTDVDGDGGNLNPAGTERLDGADRRNWGLEVMHSPFGSEDGADTDRDDGSVSKESAAVIGVSGDRVRFSYKDTDGVTRRFEVRVDIEPPVIDIAEPSRLDDQTPRTDDENINFNGTFSDDTGLAEDSFVLYVDHSNDMRGVNYALELSVSPGSATDAALLGVVRTEGAAGPGDNDDPIVKKPDDLRGFSDDNPTYGVVEASRVYLAADTRNVNTTDHVKGMTAEDFSDGVTSGMFRDEINIDFLERLRTDPSREVEPYNHPIDYQALVRDVAGNIGFSDKDVASPSYINDLGTEEKDRLGNPGNDPLPNILGVFSSHVVYIDNVDPMISTDQTVTGFYGVDRDDDPVVDRAGVMVVFDGPVDPRSIGPSTFQLSLGEGDAEVALPIIETEVEGKLVFLRLADDLASDAKPNLTIAAGEEVRDLAGRVTRWDELEKPVEVQDGILPVFTVSLSDGSGVGTGAEGPDRLTRETIKVTITSDEAIQGTPGVAVVCSDLAYKYRAEADDSDVSDYVSGLNVAANDVRVPSTLLGAPIERGPDCGNLDAESANNFSVRVGNGTSSRRDRQRWEFTWRQFPAGNKARLEDGMATVVVWGNDRELYTSHNDSNVRLRNWGSASAEFRFDSMFESPLSGGGRVLPAADGKVAERRPFVLLDFSGEPTTVTVSELLVDGVNVTESIERRGQNEFLYWPESLGSGEHEVEFSATDAANNKVEDESFKFEVTTRDPFILSLFAGWNAISFPANPQSNSLDSIFGAAPVDRVIAWIPSSTTGPWAVATKTDGVWTTSLETASLTDMRAQYGYWVHASEFSDVSVVLQGPIDREVGGRPDLITVETYPGWNFVGVVDQDGDQTQGRAGSNLKDGIENVAGEANEGAQDDIEVKDYLEGFERAYRWDVITYSYKVLTGDDNVKIGEGIWVYYDGGIAP